MSADRRRAGALARVQAALAHIQEAQNELGRATAALSSIRPGSATRWAQLRKLYDRVHAEWYRVEALLANSRIELDHDPSPDELAGGGL